MEHCGTEIDENISEVKLTDLSPIDINPDTFLYEHCTLPSLPDVLMQLQEAMYSDDVSVDLVAELISRDTGLTAQTLKIVNSAYYSLPIQISEVKLAVAYLGINEVYRIVLSISVINTLTTENAEAFHEIWFHSLYAALCVKLIATKFDPLVNANELWAAGILHDIGKFIYLKFFPDHFQKVRAYAHAQGIQFSTAEEHFDNPTSAYMGTLLCDRWRLPSIVHKVCAIHNLKQLSESNIDKPDRTFIALVSVGNMLAVLANENLTKKTREQLSKKIIEHLKLSEDEFLLLMSEITELKTDAHHLMSRMS